MVETGGARGMNAEPDISALKRLLTEAFGEVPSSLTRIVTRSHTWNARLALASGRVVLVKVAPRRTRLARVDHPLAVRDVFPERELELGDRRVYCLEWKTGRATAFDALTDGELDDFIKAYGSFRVALGAGKIHGDLNCNNILFEGGRVSAILDLEEVRDGHPAEDWARYVLTSAEHLPVFAILRRRRIVRRFARLAAATGIPFDAWRQAFEGFAAAKRARKMRKGRLTVFERLNLAWRCRFYRRLLAAIEGRTRDLV